MRLLSEIMIDYFNDPRNWRMKLLTEWENFDIAKHVRIMRIDETTLVLGTPNSAWQNEIFWIRDGIKNTVNKFLGGDYITNVRPIVIGYQATQPQLEPERPVYVRPPSRDLTKKEIAGLEKIGDIRLREALGMYLKSCT